MLSTLWDGVGQERGHFLVGREKEGQLGRGWGKKRRTFLVGRPRENSLGGAGAREGALSWWGGNKKANLLVGRQWHHDNPCLTHCNGGTQPGTLELLLLLLLCLLLQHFSVVRLHHVTITLQGVPYSNMQFMLELTD